MSISKDCLVVVRLRVCRVPRPRIAPITVTVVIIVITHETVKRVRKLWRRAAGRLAARYADAWRPCVTSLLHGAIALLVLLFLLNFLVIFYVRADLRDREELVHGERKVAEAGHVVVVDEDLLTLCW